jgi:hypothetical protein
VFEEKEFNNEEQRAFEALRGWLEEWRGRCAVYHFLPTVPASSHSMDDCESVLSQRLRSLSSKFQTRMSRLVVQQTLSCPWCFVPRIICNRWVKGAANRWADSGEECQYHKIIIPAILVMVEFDKECRDTNDTWLDFHGIYSRNLDKLCQWVSGRSVGNNLYAIRIAKMFLLLRNPWMQLSHRKSRGGYVPNPAGYHRPLTKQGLVSWWLRKLRSCKRLSLRTVCVASCVLYHKKRAMIARISEGKARKGVSTRRP